MVHQMFGAHFVNTSQNKDNLLIYSKKIRKSSYKMQKNVISFFCTLIFLSNSQKIHIQRIFLIHLFYLFIYLFVLQLTSQNSVCRKKCYFFLPFLILSFFFQTRKNSHTTHLFYLFIYLFVLQLTSQNSVCRKNVISFFLS